MIAELFAVIALKLAHLVAGVIICFLGKSLLIRGVRADFLGEGEIDSKKLRIVTSSPGLIFLIAGLVIVITTIVTQAEYVHKLNEEQLTLRFARPNQTASEKTNDSGTISDRARAASALAKIVANSTPPSKARSTDAVIILNTLSSKANVSSSENLIALLDELINEDPKSVTYLFQDEKYLWLLKDATAVNTLYNLLQIKLVKLSNTESPKSQVRER